MSYLEELLPEFRKGAKIRRKDWDKGAYIVCNGIFVENNLGRIYRLTNSDITGNVWELYKDPEPDWDYIIKNKCLCWFWNNTGKTKYLNYLQAKEEYVFRDEQGACWENCRPALRDEVTFYEVEYE